MLISLSGFAYQSNLNGTITSDNGQELERAFVVVLNADDLSYVTGTVTDEHGNFTIEGVKGGNYVISVHHISFDAPKIVAKWNPETQLNVTSKLLKLPSREAVTLDKLSVESVVSDSVALGQQKLVK
jgi:hypothetical protein